MMKTFRKSSEEFIEALINREMSKETTDGYRKDMEMVSNFLEKKYNGIVMLEDPVTQDFEDYLTMLLKEKNYQPASVNRHLNTLRSFYKTALKKGWTKENKVAAIDQLKVNRKERTFINDEEYATLIDSINHETIKAIIPTLFYTGLRISECLSMTLEDVNLTEKNILVQKGKGNKQRKIPISVKLLPILEAYKNKTRPKYVDSEYFFALSKTGRVSDQYVNRVLNETTKKLGWKKKVTCHVFRHSFASNLVRNNVHIVQIQHLLGHEDLKTTSIYVHSLYEQLSEAIDTL